MRTNLLAGLVDEGHAADASFVAGEAFADVVEEAGVDLVDDLQMAREQRAEQWQRPASRGLRAGGCGWCS